MNTNDRLLETYAFLFEHDDKTLIVDDTLEYIQSLKDELEYAYNKIGEAYKNGYNDGYNMVEKEKIWDDDRIWKHLQKVNGLS